MQGNFSKYFIKCDKYKALPVRKEKHILSLGYFRKMLLQETLYIMFCVVYGAKQGGNTTMQYRLIAQKIMSKAG